MSYSTELSSNSSSPSFRLVRGLTYEMYLKKGVCLISCKVVDVADGDTYEVKSFDPRKAFAVQPIFKPGAYYRLFNANLKEHLINSNYCNCDFATSGSGWWLQPLGSHERPSRGRAIYCEVMFSNRVNNILDNGGVLDMIGFYKSYYEPETYKKGNIQGYFVEMRDARGEDFEVLVWFNPKYDTQSNFDVFHCRQGDVLYIPMARRSNPNDCGSPLTTLHHLVRKPEFVSLESMQKLRGYN